MNLSQLNWRSRQDKILTVLPIALRDVRGDISTRDLAALIAGLLDAPRRQAGLVGRVLGRLAKAGHQSAYRTGEKVVIYGHVGERFAWRGMKPATIYPEIWSE